MDPKHEFFGQLKLIAFDFIKLSDKLVDNLSPEERQAIEDLAENKSIVITKSDKGNGVVIQNKSDYIKKVNELLIKDNKFKRIEYNKKDKTGTQRDITIDRENKLQCLLRKLKKEKKISQEVYDRVMPCGSRAGVLYGLPKVHKTGAPIRPIISAVQTYNYKLAKFLDEILKPLANKGGFMLKDSFDFVNRVSKISLTPNQAMCSFDVNSLFTQIPVLETIELILDRAFAMGRTLYCGFDRATLKELLIICTQESHFLFQGNYYDQVDGVAMGSPLGPLFANIFMDHFESIHMEKLKELGVLDWMRL